MFLCMVGRRFVTSRYLLGAHYDDAALVDTLPKARDFACSVFDSLIHGRVQNALSEDRDAGVQVIEHYGFKDERVVATIGGA